MTSNTGAARQKRYLDRGRANGWRRVMVMVPEDRVSQLQAIAAEWRFKDPRPSDYAGDDAPGLPGLDGGQDHD